MTILLTIVPALGSTLGSSLTAARAASGPVRPLVGQTPDAVTQGKATLRGHHNSDAALTLNISLGVHNSAQLDAIIATASSPLSPQYGHYLTRAEYLTQFAPTDAEVQAVKDWATGAGLSVQSVSPEHLIVAVEGTTGQVEHALGVNINDYSLPGRTFYSNDRDPAVPSNLDIRAISGLSTIHRFHTAINRLPDARVCDHDSQGVTIFCYYPNDFRSAYNVPTNANGGGQTIGFTLWGAAVPQRDLHAFANNTGTTELVAGQAGADGIDWIPVNRGSTDTNELDETAMDVEYAHGVAPGSHLKYWLGDCSYNFFTGKCNPSDKGLEDAISAAANDTSLHVVSNSWGGGEADSADDSFVAAVNQSLQYAASVGTTFYFSTGDNGYASGAQCDPRHDSCSAAPSFPADSPYVVAVGGTSLGTSSNDAYNYESAWSGSGGGCSLIFARPFWQQSVSAATCGRRAIPDVSADADSYRGAYVYYNGAAQPIGGTSLAAPLWAGMAVDVDHLLNATNRRMGFAAPGIYQLANNPTTYARDFHDVQAGNNDPSNQNNPQAQTAGPGWDEVTGWGSPNLANLAADWPAALNVPSNGAVLTLPSSTSPDGCMSNILPANDDGSTNNVPLPFTANFFGQPYTSLWVNNNGNVTFDGSLSTYTPFNLTQQNHVIIAPFFADVDTRDRGSNLVTYGATTYAGRAAFCVNWVNVGYFATHSDKINSFQLAVCRRERSNGVRDRGPAGGVGCPAGDRV